MKIEKRKLIDLLKICKDIKIPFYQRDYSWDKENVEKLLNDIYDSKTKNYFLGSIVLKPRHHKKIIIDGQQRISTILLIYKVIWEKSNRNINMDWLQEVKIDSENLRDGKHLQKILRNENGEFNSKTTETRYYENYKIIQLFLKNKGDLGLLTLYNQLEKVVLSDVVLDNDVDEHILFAQINSTGKSLSAFDLVKNYLFSNISDKLDDDTDKEEKITEMLAKLDTVTKVKSKDDVLRHFIGFNIVDLPNKNSKNIYVAFVKFYEEKYNNKSTELFDDLYKFFFYYYYLESRKWESNENFSQILNSLLESIGTYAILIISCFYENSKFINQEIVISAAESSIIKKCLLIIEAYKFKREFVQLSEKTITRYIPRISLELRNKDNFSEINTDVKLYFLLIYLPKNEHSYRMPSDEEFQNSMHKEDIYKFSRKITKSFLYRLSSFEYKDQLKFEKLTIEHVLPIEQSKWRKNGYSESVDLVLPKIHTIGNLTLTSYNPELSNNTFDMKKKLFEGSDSFPLNKYFINSENKINEWNIFEIDKRTDVLFNICQRMWNFEEYKEIVSEEEKFVNYVENQKTAAEKKKIDLAGKNGGTFSSNASSFRDIKELINEYNIHLILKNLMVNGFSTEKNEFEVFGERKKGWISQSIYDFLDISSKTVKGKYTENEFDTFIKNNDVLIKCMIEHMQEELS